MKVKLIFLSFNLCHQKQCETSDTIGGGGIAVDTLCYSNNETNQQEIPINEAASGF